MYSVQHFSLNWRGYNFPRLKNIFLKVSQKYMSFAKNTATKEMIWGQILTWVPLHGTEENKVP